MDKLIITLIVTAAFAIPFLSMHAPEKTVYGPDSHRGCIASAYQADARGVASGTLEVNLADCDQLLVAD